jgi:hypothetical protein
MVRSKMFDPGYIFLYNLERNQGKGLTLELQKRLFPKFMFIPDSEVNVEHIPPCNRKLYLQGRRRFYDALLRENVFPLEEYCDYKTDVPAICDQGHEIGANPIVAKRGGNVCSICSGHDSHAAGQKFYAEVTKRGWKAIGKYTGTNGWVEVECAFGHIFEVRPNMFPRHGCVVCSRKGGQMGRLNAASEFESSVKEQGGIMRGKYTDAITPVECECRVGHVCYPVPTRVARGGGICNACAGHNQAVNEAEFRQFLDEQGAEMKGPWCGLTKRIECVCGVGHKCHPRPDLCLRQGYGICLQCASLDQKVNESKFREAIAKWGGEVKGKYRILSERVDCTCPKGHPCRPLPAFCVSGRPPTCQTCCESSGERLVKDILSSTLGYSLASIRTQCPLPDNKEPDLKSGRHRYDFVVLRQGTRIVIEYDGEQHFHDTVHYYKEPGTFESRRRVDWAKTKVALESGARIIRIHYSWLKVGRIVQEQFLRTALESTAPFVINILNPYGWLHEFHPQLLSPLAEMVRRKAAMGPNSTTRATMDDSAIPLDSLPAPTH